jgi:hypothetical protein
MLLLEGVESDRFAMLLNEFIDLKYLNDFYAIGDPRHNSNLLQAIKRFSDRPLFDGDRISRYVIEGFLQKNRVLPRKWMAARLGLTPDYFTRLLPQMQRLLPRNSYVVHAVLIDHNLIEDCVTNLPGLRFRTFSDHESFCSRLHEALAKELAIPNQEFHANALWCATDQWLAGNADDGDYPRRYAQHFDCITCEPLSLAHATWLDFRKPMSLSPDRCSKLTYVRYHEELERYNAGTREPDDLARYRRAVELAGV